MNPRIKDLIYILLFVLAFLVISPYTEYQGQALVRTHKALAIVIAYGGWLVAWNIIIIVIIRQARKVIRGVKNG